MSLIKSISNDLNNVEQQQLAEQQQLVETYQSLLNQLCEQAKSKIILNETLNVLLDRIEMMLNKIKQNPNSKSSEDVFLVLSAFEAVRQNRIKGPHINDVIDDASSLPHEKIYKKLLDKSGNVEQAVVRFAEKLKKDFINGGQATSKLIKKLKSLQNNKDVDPFKYEPAMKG